MAKPVIVRFLSDDRQLRQTLGSLDSRVGAVGERMGALGARMTRSVTLPLAAVGAAAVKTFSDFEASISKIGGLVLGTTEGLDELKESVLGLAGETARGPQELADAMFAVQSAGLRGEEAMDALEIAAKASAAGLGETKDVALAAAAAMTAYQREGLTAADATDILTNTVREGNLEAGELAGSLGRVIPVASAAGVSLDEVGAAIALITRTGASASDATTQVASAIKQLNAPTAESIPLINEAFGSLDNFRSVLQDRGLLVAFRELEERFGAQPEKLRKILGSAEALNGVLAITGSEASEVDRVFASLADSAGVTEGAFDIASQTTAFKFNKAMTDLKTSLIDVGAVLAPLAATIAGFVGDIAQAFGNLDPALQTVAIAFAGIVAAMGPVMAIGARMITLVRGIGTAVLFLATSSNVAALSVGALGAAFAGATVAFFVFRQLIAEGRKLQEDFANHSLTTVNNLALLELGIKGTSDELRDQAVAAFINQKAWEGNTSALEGLTEQQKDLAPMVEEAASVLRHLAAESDVSAERIAQLANEMGINLGNMSEEAREKLAGAITEISRGVTPTERLGQVTETLGNEFATTAESVDAFDEALDALLGSFLSAEEAQIRLREEVRDLHAEFATGRREGESYAAMEDRMRQAAISLTRAVTDEVEALVRDERITSDAATQKAEMIARLKELQQQFPPLAGLLQEHIDKIAAIPDEKVTKITLNIDDAIDEANRLFRALPTELQLSPEGFPLPEFHEGGVVPGPRGQEQLILAKGGETVLPTHKPGFALVAPSDDRPRVEITVNEAQHMDEATLLRVAAWALAGH